MKYTHAYLVGMRNAQKQRSLMLHDGVFSLQAVRDALSQDMGIGSGGRQAIHGLLQYHRFGQQYRTPRFGS